MSTQEQYTSSSAAYIVRKEDGQSVTQTILEAVAELSNRSIIPDDTAPKGDASTPLPPLYEAINPDALNTVCQSATDEIELAVSFTYCGYGVTVKNGDEIVVFEK